MERASTDQPTSPKAPHKSTAEEQLCQFLADLPFNEKFRYTPTVAEHLTTQLFWSLIGGKHEYVQLLFPGASTILPQLKLREAQDAQPGAEYTTAARGKRCGHIIKTGEMSYMCRTCGADETCCLCVKCFNNTNHEGHQIRINVSSSGTGCCDCGDEEAWVHDLKCKVHSTGDEGGSEDVVIKDVLDGHLKNSITMTIGRVLDYICDVISCSPEQLRSPKTKESVTKDHQRSRLLPPNYPEFSSSDSLHSPVEYCLIIWNDEKHTLSDVQVQISQACKKRSTEARKHAIETDGVGRSILVISTDVELLLRMAKKLEEIRVTITIRSARDTFREQMCATMVEWLQDISGCRVGSDDDILINTICSEMLKPWREGSWGDYKTIRNIDDEAAITEEIDMKNHLQHYSFTLLRAFDNRFFPEESDDDLSDIDESEGLELLDDGGDNLDLLQAVVGPDTDFDEEMNQEVIVVPPPGPPPPPQMNLETTRNAPTVVSGDARIAVDTVTGPGLDFVPNAGATVRPTTVAARIAADAVRDRDATPSEVDAADPVIAAGEQAVAEAIPKTPGHKYEKPCPGKYWKETPERYHPDLWKHQMRDLDGDQSENVFHRVRLDYLILFDVRLWKQVRKDLRHLYISTVIKIPEFKAILGRRFAALYTILAQLYLVGDREPDHSIISLSLQMFTTPSITKELVETANFLTNLLSILYTFLTTRQVSHPWEVSSDAILAFESGSVTNRRMYHFYMDLKHLFQSPHVQKCLREEPRYIMQFLDLVKLHQGIGPNKRAMGEHVEYETDSWITASLVTREINRMAYQFAKAFRNPATEDMPHLKRAIRITARALTLHCLGAECDRFGNAEIRCEAKFKWVDNFEFDPDVQDTKIVDFKVDNEYISFHHALHYTLSWLIESGREMSAEELRELLLFDDIEKKIEYSLMGPRALTEKAIMSPPEDKLLNVFDFPLRVCAWLSQIKTNMWVRNGISLRHQAATYRGVAMRDVCYQRDVFLLQTALVTCNPSRVLASIVDRYDQGKFMEGFFEITAQSQDEMQHLDVIEDMVHLMINILSDRLNLLPPADLPDPMREIMRRDITHVLYIKPLSFSEITAKVSDRYTDSLKFTGVLHEVTNFELREGNSGIFTLKPEFAEKVDIFNSNFTRNQREDAEARFREIMSQKLGKKSVDVVFEPTLMPINSGVFKELGAATSCGMFSQTICYCLIYCFQFKTITPKIQQSRIDVFLNTVLHLVLIGVAEDRSVPGSGPEVPSFLRIAANTRSTVVDKEAPNGWTIIELLQTLDENEAYSACHAKIDTVLRRMHEKRPDLLGDIVKSRDTSDNTQENAEAERERKRKAALAKQKAVMAQFKQQQNEFLGKQGKIDWGVSDDEDEEMEVSAADSGKPELLWKFPSDCCLQCQEKTDDRRVFGTFALIMPSRIVRTTDLQDPLIVEEVCQTPDSLDHAYPRDRPFGLAGKTIVSQNLMPTVDDKNQDIQVLGRSFPREANISGPVSTSCGHLMHLSCFETYAEATKRRHAHQVARHHPESLSRNEFVCPLCKALANTFIPIMWKPRIESWPGLLESCTDLGQTFDRESASPYYNRYPDGTGAKVPAWNQIQETLVLSIFNAVTELNQAEVDIGASAIPDLTPKARPQLSPLAAEIEQVYLRIARSLQSQQFQSGKPSSDLSWNSKSQSYFNEIMTRSVAFSIAAAEIQQRGVQPVDTNLTGFTLVTDGIPEITMTHLKILSETVQSYLVFGNSRSQTDKPIWSEYSRDARTQMKQLFISEYPDDLKNGLITPVLSIDGFILLTDYAYCLSEAHGVEISHLIRLCYLIELVRVVHHIRNSIPNHDWTRLLEVPLSAPGEAKVFGKFCESLMSMTLDASWVPSASPIEKNAGFPIEKLSDLASILGMVKKYALIFLRKTTILMYAKYRVNFSFAKIGDSTASELARLTKALMLPDLEEMFMAALPEATSVGWPDQIQSLISGWVTHEISWPGYPSMDKPHQLQSTICPELEMLRPMGLCHPGIFELIGLPHQFDMLIDEASRARCPTTGNDVQDATICLLCGEIFCSQSTCCIKTTSSENVMVSLGGSQQHMLKCQAVIGIFISIRKCCTFYLHRRSGSFSSAPYLDIYGEADMGLRHGRRLFLNQKRYDQLRKAWLNHEVPSFISRKLEAEVNNGGWETI